MMRHAMVSVLVLAFAAAVARGDEAAEKVLADKGLTLRGNTYVLKSETELPKLMAEFNKTKRELAAAEREYRKLEKKINQAKAYIAERQYYVEQLKGDTRKAQTQEQYNKLIDQINAATRDLNDTIKQKQDAERENQIAYDNAKAEYVNKVIEVSKAVEQINQQYEQLAADAAVTQALQAVSADGRTFGLGPMRSLESTQRLIGREMANIESGVIKLRREGTVFVVDVQVNGKVTREMTLDTGAGAISLPHDMAIELGLEITDADPTVRVQLADGKLVDAKLKILESVQVGQFKVENVEALVLPQELVAATPLLGNSFLKHFQVKLHPEEEELSLVRIATEQQ